MEHAMSAHGTVASSFLREPGGAGIGWMTPAGM
jgi:hypothetical protein